METSDHEENQGIRPQSTKSKLAFILTITLVFMVIEAVVGYSINSLALVADAGHMLNDVFSILLAIIAIVISSRQHSKDYTFGYHRIEVLSGLINGLSLIFIAGYITYEAVDRAIQSTYLEINGSLLLVTAFVGLVINLLAMWVLHQDSDESVNIEGVYHHLLADSLGSIATILAGVVILLWQWYWIDLVVSVFISIIVFNSGYQLSKKVVRILFEASPNDADMTALLEDIRELEGIVEVHDLHGWTLTSGKNILMGHVSVEPGRDRDWIREHISFLAQDKYGFDHITLQMEGKSCKATDGCFPEANTMTATPNLLDS
jgi:cobalt-zinc-cadmium efflux system protein